MKTLTELNNRLKENSRLTYLATLGLFSTMTNSTSGVFDDLVEKGRVAHENRKPSKANETLGRVKALSDKAGERLQAGLNGTLGRLGIPSRKEICELTVSVEKLTAKVQNLKTKTA